MLNHASDAEMTLVASLVTIVLAAATAYAVASTTPEGTRRKIWSGVSIAILAFAVWVAVNIATPDPPPPILRNVRADMGWQTLGYVDESVEFRVSATGEWSPWPNYSVDADGCVDRTVCADGRNSTANETTQFEHAVLILRIGDGDILRAGKGGIFRAEADGPIQFRINDRDFTNNGGAVTVRIEFR